MPVLLVSKSPPLRGEIAVHGAKNSVLPILAAALLCRTPCVLHNCPDIVDVSHTLAILRALGCDCRRDGSTLYIDARAAHGGDIPPELAGRMRASSLFLGALLARWNRAALTLPGGCPIGSRPLDFHLLALGALGAHTCEQDGMIVCTAKRLTGGRIRLPGPSVGATENAILAATAADGVTTIENAAREPEIVDLANFLRTCGAKISGAGTKTITIEGPCALHGATYTVLPDRIEAATFLCACAACGGAITLRRAAPQMLAPVLDALRASGCAVTCGSDTITLARTGRLTACRAVTSVPYPGFPTDAMPVLMAAQLRAEGETSFTETIFERRFGYARELEKLGADITRRGNTVFLSGVPALHGARLFAEDLRGGAALVLAAMCAEGESAISGVKHIERGYDNLAEDLASLGGAVRLCADAPMRVKTLEIPKTM